VCVCVCMRVCVRVRVRARVCVCARARVCVCGNQSDYSHSPFTQEQCLVQCCKRNFATNRYRETVSLTQHYVPVTDPQLSGKNSELYCQLDISPVFLIRYAVQCQFKIPKNSKCRSDTDKRNEGLTYGDLHYL
jgi:hypothetical protein